VFTELMPVVRIYRTNACGAQKNLSLRSLLHQPVFMMQAAEYGSLLNPVPDRQTVSVLVGGNLLRLGLRQTRAQRRMRPPPVMADCPIPNRHLQLAFA
jgi:hypothetical protein